LFCLFCFLKLFLPRLAWNRDPTDCINYWNPAAILLFL
jgi:hypothetical protein